MGRTILFLEDDSTVRMLTGLMLTSAGYKAKVLSSLAELESLTPEQVLDVDVAVIDFSLGYTGKEGIQATQWLQNNGFTGPIVFVTGYDADYIKPSLRGVRYNRIVTKPVLNWGKLIESLLQQG